MSPRSPESPLEPTVFVVDDDAAVRQSFEWLVGSVGLRTETFESARAFLKAYDPARPGCLVLDVRMPGMSGLELQERLLAEGITLPIIMVSGYGDVPTAVRVMKQGAVDFVEKPFSDQAMLDRIQASIERDQRTREADAERAGARDSRASLTRRETEVMESVIAGRSNKEIARALAISPKTVEVHRANVMKKMRADSLADLVRLAERGAQPG